MPLGLSQGKCVGNFEEDVDAVDCRRVSVCAARAKILLTNTAEALRSWSFGIDRNILQRVHTLRLIDGEGSS